MLWVVFFLKPSTGERSHWYLKGFLRHLYQHKNGRNLAPLVVSRRVYAQEKPPKFLRPAEVQKLFAGLSLGSPTAIRTHAMVHLAFFLGLRPVEIHSISLDDTVRRWAMLKKVSNRRCWLLIATL